MGFFENIKKGVNNLSTSIVGPNYDYTNNIKDTDKMGLGTRGGDITRNISGIISYIDILIDGTGAAVMNTRPLNPNQRNSKNTPAGSKFFLKTAGKCRDIETGELVDRSMYINNQPQSVINWLPTPSSLNLGGNFRGYAPSILNNIGEMNPVRMFRGFIMGANPDCKEVNLEVINGNSGKMDTYQMQSAYLALDEIEELKKYGSVTASQANSVENRREIASVNNTMIEQLSKPTSREKDLKKQLDVATKKKQKKKMKKLQRQYDQERNARLQQLKIFKAQAKAIEGMANYNEETKKGYNWMMKTIQEEIPNTSRLQDISSVILLTMILFILLCIYKKNK